MARIGVREDSTESAGDFGVGSGSQASETACWFDVDPTPVFMVDAKGTILAANRRARRLVGPGRALNVRGGQLGLSDFEAQDSFTEALKKVTSAASEAAVVLRCDDGRWRRLHLLRGDDLSADIVFITIHGDPERQADIRPIVEAFRLTFAEGNVLLHVAKALPPKRIATRLGVSLHTVRAHLRSLYVKMHVRGMQELIREYTRLTA